MQLTKSKWNRLFVHPEQAPGGCYVALTWKREWQEWCVCPSWNGDADYFTNDSDDAIATAYHMIEQKQASEHRETAPADCLCAVCIPH